MGSQSLASPPLLPARLVIPWVVLLGVALAVGIGLGSQGVDYPTPFAIAHAFRLLVGAELFFLLVLVPLLTTGRHAQPRLLNLLLLLGLGAPAVIVAAWVSDCEWPQVAASQAYLVAAALFVAAWLRADADGAFLSWYWLALGALGAGGPIVAFIAEDLLRARMDWLYAASPFWAADRLCLAWEGAGAFTSAGVLLALSAILFALSVYRRRLTPPAQRLY